MATHPWPKVPWNSELEDVPGYIGYSRRTRLYIFIIIVSLKLESKAKEATQEHELTEEYEDQQGNVFTKKTYLDLKRQGLL